MTNSIYPSLIELRESFKLYDKDGNGSISPFEIKAVLLSIGEEIDEDDVHEIIKEIDEDGKKRRWQVNFCGPWSLPSEPICF